MNKRPIRIDGELAYVTLTKGFEAVVDIADVPLVSGFNWTSLVGAHNVYAVRKQYINGVAKRLYMHRIIVGVDSDEILVDHIDGDGLNNRRNNLRHATPTGNSRNRCVSKTSKSGIKGVNKDDRYGTWRARIRVNKKEICLGTFKTPEEAQAAYAKASREYHGIFGRAS